jgi:exopolyphosphatase/guanosine-5'-triphosphate,3'-diphosphate pyrophosphatase
MGVAQSWAVVDIGSNTVHLLVARSDGCALAPLVDQTANLRLGGEVDRGGEIGPAKVDELIATLCAFQDAATAAGAARLYCFATEAMRAATNGAVVLSAVTAATGLPVHLLPPDVEAALGYQGAVAAAAGAGLRAVVDIGGGSLQVFVGEGAAIRGSVSLPLGGARLVARFLPDDPPSAADEARLAAYLAEVIPPALPLRNKDMTALLGTGGTLRRLPALLDWDPARPLPGDALEAALARLRGQPAARLVANADMPADRARMLLPALLALREVWRGYHAPPLRVVPTGVREGAILQLARSGVNERGELLWP